MSNDDDNDFAQARAISEDESSISSCAALLDLNIHNGDVRLKKRDSIKVLSDSGEKLKKPNFIVPSIVFDTSDVLSNDESGENGDDESSLGTLNGGEDSILQLDDCDNQLDDYLEDYILPMSHESVMSRQLSFRRKVQKQLETAAAERAVLELDRFEAMLSTYDEEDEYREMNSSSPKVNNSRSSNNSNMDSLSSISTSSTPTGDDSRPVPKSRGKSIPNGNNNGAFLLNVSSSNQHNNSSHNRTGSYGSPKGFPNGVGLDMDFDTSSGAPSLSLDIDAIVKENAPNLMGGDSRKNSSASDVTIPEHGPEESMSSYFIPQPTLEKLHAVYESSNFNNIYCLSGELKDILTPVEIEEIVANKDHLEKFIDPNVMAALSWSINEASLPYITPGNNNSSSNVEQQNKLNVEKQEDTESSLERTDLTMIENSLKPGSKSSSMSNGFHSDASTSEDDMHSNDDAASSTSSSRLEVPNDEDGEHLNGDSNSANSKKMVPVKDKYSETTEDGNNSSSTNLSEKHAGFQRGAPMTNSFRRKISIGRDTPKSPSRICYSPDGSSSVKRGNSQESLETDLGVCEDDWEEDEDDNINRSSKSPSSGVVLVRRDSKRFSFKNKDGQVERVVEGLFVESKNPNPNGTLRRIRAPLNLTEDIGDDGLESPEGSSLVEVKEQENEVKSPKVHKKRISVDDKILSVISTDLDDNSAATDCTQSDVFHSIINTLRDEDATMKSDGDEVDDITLDIDTPDDMEDSILEQLDSLSAQPRDLIQEYSAEEELEDARRWKSFKVGPNDIQIDLKAIHPYRRVLSHGGYFDAEKNIAIILFSGCYLPDRSRKEYTYLMDHLFLYVLSTLEELVVDDYILVYLHGATPKSCMPTFGWLKRCYQLIDRRLKKNLKALYMVHPTFWLRTIVALTKPFVSTKFSRKVQFVNTLSDLCLEIPTEHLVIPDRVLQYDFDLKVDDLKRRKIMS
ncbi:Protein prune 2 [Orchesella cincta]|uniref:Protein prune 2 n=1 Tax=Orchesella cincta TaxID=48709 RepID=A0A1D2NB43_ORCCI|nr:Protein prune 2 [Orchesella cincta]